MKNVSVIVPIYNVEQYLDQCLSSLQKQTLKNIEIILIDDGSTDSSSTIAQSYAEQYANFSYYRIPNGGLGHARNTGAQYARGEYLFFVDSDDYVPDYACEKMYRLGLCFDADLVVGDVVRLTSKGDRISNLHKRAFNGASQIMHITKNPNLFFDTTAWNKLFRRDFYEKEKLKWAEGMLYEDIPVTIPAHFKANKVVYLNEVVYKWRVRDGENLSITQRRRELPNFLDRLKAIKMVDEFAESASMPQACVIQKDFKHLDLDLKMYIQELPNGDEQFRSTVVSEIQQYLHCVNQAAFWELRAIDRLKYYYVKQGDLSKLESVLEYEHYGYRTLSVYRNGLDLFGRFPYSNLPSNLTNMSSEIKRSGAQVKILSATFLDKDLCIKGSIKTPKLGGLKNNIVLNAILVNETQSSIADLSVDLEGKKIAPKVAVSRKYRKIRVWNNPVSYFSIKIPINMLKTLQPTDYRVVLLYKAGSLSFRPLALSNPKKGTVCRPKSFQIESKTISVSYDAYYCLRISVNNLQGIIKNLACSGNTITYCLSEKEFRISDNLDIGCEAQIAGPDVFLEQEPTFLFQEGYWLRFATNNQGFVFMRKVPEGILANRASLHQNKLLIECQLPEYDHDFIQISEAYFEGKHHKAIVPVSLVQNDKENLQVALDFSNQTHVSRMREDSYYLVLIVKTTTGMSTLKAYNASTKINVPIVCTNSRWRYTLHTTSQYLELTVAETFAFYENSKRRRRVIEKYLYPLFRLLPIKQNRILFESSWGAKTDCNPGALYDYIDSYYPGFSCMWSLKDTRSLSRGSGIAVHRGSLKYYIALARSKYFINNVNFADDYIKRKGQIEIQTMHGTPLKTLGLDVPGELTDQESRNRFLRRCGRWDYLVVQGERAINITRSCYAYNKEYLTTGYPRNDKLFFNNQDDYRNKIKANIGIAPDKKFVLYAPTWRKKGQFDLVLDFNQLINKLGDKYEFGIRVHQFALPGFDPLDLHGRVHDVSEVQDMEDLYLIADAIITDYSSLMFDYAILDKPLLFYVYDLEDYRDNLRGFNIDLEEEAPGPLLRTTDDVINALNSLEKLKKDYSKQHSSFKEKYCTYEAGTASQQIIEKALLRHHGSFSTRNKR